MKLKELFYQWQKKNNPFFPNEMKWDRNTIYKMIDDFENELVALPQALDEALPVEQELHFKT